MSVSVASIMFASTFVKNCQWKEIENMHRWHFVMFSAPRVGGILQNGVGIVGDNWSHVATLFIIQLIYLLQHYMYVMVLFDIVRTTSVFISG